MREEEGPGCKRVGGPLRPDVLRVLLGQVYVGLLQDPHTPFIIIITRPSRPMAGKAWQGESWGQNTVRQGTCWGDFNISLTASGGSAITGYSHVPN